LVLHDPNFALRFCDRVLLLFGDGTHLAGPVADVLDEVNLTRLYLPMNLGLLDRPLGVVCRH
jgi:iron complex transport system ATP-binding protein